MDHSLLFYDVETSGLDRGRQRIVQFAAQRTTLGLEPIGDPVSVAVRLDEDVVPEPEAIVVSGRIFSEMREGVGEYRLSQTVDELLSPGTVAVGFNNVSFDDGFIDHLRWRTFRDPYSWRYADGRGRLDLLTLAYSLRATGAPLAWPEEGEQPINRLADLCLANDVPLERAHDAAADVEATIGLARRFRSADEAAFTRWLAARNKAGVRSELESGKPVLLTANRGFGPYATALVETLSTDGQTALVYDLRCSPERFSTDHAELDDYVANGFEEDEARRPVQQIRLNGAPLVAPATALTDAATRERLGIDREAIRGHLETLRADSRLRGRLRAAFVRRQFDERPGVEYDIYRGFVPDSDRPTLADLASTPIEELESRSPSFDDPRLGTLWFLYRARHRPDLLLEAESVRWRARLEAVRAVGPEYWAEWKRARADADERIATDLDELRAWIERI